MTKEETIISNLYEAKKVDLASHKVDLALIDDVKKAYAEAINARKKSLDAYLNVQKQVQAGIKLLTELKTSNEQFIPVVERFESAAKGLGIDVPKEILDQKKNIQDGLKGNLLNYTKTLQSIKF
jgi:hypothetical protein